MPALSSIVGFSLIGVAVVFYIRSTIQTAAGLTELKLYEMRLEEEQHERCKKNARDEGINEERERNAKEKQDLLDKIALLEKTTNENENENKKDK